MTASVAALLSERATTSILGSVIEQRDCLGGQSCRVVHWPHVQVEEQVANFCYDATP